MFICKLVAVVLVFVALVSCSFGDEMDLKASESRYGSSGYSNYHYPSRYHSYKGYDAFHTDYDSYGGEYDSYDRGYGSYSSGYDYKKPSGYYSSYDRPYRSSYRVTYGYNPESYSDHDYRYPNKGYGYSYDHDY